VKKELIENLSMHSLYVRLEKGNTGIIHDLIWLYPFFSNDKVLIFCMKHHLSHIVSTVGLHGKLIQYYSFPKVAIGLK
jgi:hypothetical protein